MTKNHLHFCAKLIAMTAVVAATSARADSSPYVSLSDGKGNSVLREPAPADEDGRRETITVIVGGSVIFSGIMSVHESTSFGDGRATIRYATKGWFAVLLTLQFSDSTQSGSAQLAKQMSLFNTAETNFWTSGELSYCQASATRHRCETALTSTD